MRKRDLIKKTWKVIKSNNDFESFNVAKTNRENTWNIIRTFIKDMKASQIIHIRRLCTLVQKVHEHWTDLE